MLNLKVSSKIFFATLITLLNSESKVLANNLEPETNTFSEQLGVVSPLQEQVKEEFNLINSSPNEFSSQLEVANLTPNLLQTEELELLTKNTQNNNLLAQTQSSQSANQIEVIGNSIFEEEIKNIIRLQDS